MADAVASSGGNGVAEADCIDPRRLFAFLTMVFGMFMAILDIQIVSASLSEIQAGLAASSSEITWVQTAYLIAEVVMIPLSGFLSRALGTRTLFAVAAGGFAAASLMCGLSTTINEMIFWRAVQGRSVVVERNGALLEISEEDAAPQASEGQPGPSVTLLVEDVDAEVERLRTGGVEILAEPRDDATAHFRVARILDGDGRRVKLREPIGPDASGA